MNKPPKYFTVILLSLLSALSIDSSRAAGLPSTGTGARSALSTSGTASGAPEYYFVCFTRDGQISRGDVCGNEACEVRGLAGSSFLTTKNGIRVLGGSLLLRGAQRPLDVVTSAGTFKVAAGECCFIDVNGQVVVERAAKIQQIEYRARKILCEGRKFVMHPVAYIRSGNAAKQAEPQTASTSKAILSVCQMTTEQNKQLQKLKMLSNNLDLVRQSQPCKIAATKGTVFSVNPDLVNVVTGTALIDAPSGTSIQVPGGDLQVRKRAVLSVRTLTDCTCVENCSAAQTVNLTVHGATLPVEGGHGVIIKSGCATTADVPLDGIRRRRFVEFTNGGVSVIASEFLPASLFCSNSTFLHAMNKPITVYQVHLSAELIKGSAALSVATSAHGGFFVRPASMPVYRLGTFMDPIALKKGALQQIPRASS